MKRFAVIRYAFAASLLHLAFISVVAEARPSSAALPPPPASQEQEELVTRVSVE